MRNVFLLFYYFRRVAQPFIVKFRRFIRSSYCCLFSLVKRTWFSVRIFFFYVNQSFRCLRRVPYRSCKYNFFLCLFARFFIHLLYFKWFLASFKFVLINSVFFIFFYLNFVLVNRK